MRVRIFSPGWRRIVRFSSGYFSRTRFRSGAASGVFIAVYQTTSRSIPAALAGRAGANRPRPCQNFIPRCAKREGAMSQTVGPFANLDESALRALAPHGAVRSFSKNAVVVSEGDESDSLYILLSGRVKAFVC